MISRRQLLGLGLVLPLLGAWPTNDTDLEAIRGILRSGIQRDSGGAVSAVFGMDPAVVAEVLQRATREDALPGGYAPTDLVSVAAAGVPAAGYQVLRRIVLEDARALIEEAANAGNNLYVGSGYRSEAYQADVFAAQVRRWGDEDTANRYSARPGHSQHQLGTTIDVTDAFGAFRKSPAADWLRDNAHRFGFVLPYTQASVPLTGYVDEPWHARWVGRMLASALQAAGYQDWNSMDADDVVALVRSDSALDG